MSDKFQNKYRIPSARLQNWDYKWSAAYFVTICTKNRECYFGDIVDCRDTMHCVSTTPTIQLSDIGKIVQNEWLKTFEMRPDMNLTMGEYVVMPNHFHAIIGIGDNEYNTVDVGNRRCHVETQCIASLSPSEPSTPPKKQFGPQRKNLASVVRGFKIGVTTNVRKINAYFAWQPRFHDHIIRDNDSYERIRNYIIDNPKNWKNDKFNNQNNI